MVSRSSVWSARREPARRDPLLLDTHVWLWALDDRRGRMCDAAFGLVSAAAEDRRLYVSDISFWEVSLKAAKGSLLLSVDPLLWLERAARAPGIQALALTRDVLIQSTRLPGEMHGDPADRMLVAQAQLAGLTLMTCDAQLVQYAKARRGVRVCDARGR